MEMLTQKQKFIVIIIIILVIGVIAYYYINSTKEVYTGLEEENTIEVEETDEEKEDETQNKIVVHITGAVKNNGIVEVKEKARINDVVEAAGGLTEDADLGNVNLAYIVEDGQKIYIPFKSDEENSQSQENSKGKNNLNENTSSTNTNSNSTKTTDAKNILEDIITNLPEGMIVEDVKVIEGLININKASASDLQILPGIGESTANKIIEYRNKNGKFKTIEELKNVSGIGDSKFNAIKNLICV